MNRQTLREIKALPLREFERIVNEVIESETRKARAYAYNDAWASAFSALVDRYPEIMTGDVLHSIACDTVDYVNGVETASEVAAKLKERTGFDIYTPPHTDPDHEYIEKGATP